MFDPMVDRDIAKEMLKVTGVDLAIGQSSKAAYTVIATVSFDEKGKKYLIDLRRGRFSSPDTARHMIEVNNLYKPQLILVENNTYQQALIQWIKDLGGLDMPVQSFTTTVNKLNQEVGLPSLAVEIENSLWCVPMKWHEGMEEDKCDCAFCVLKKELLEYPASGHSDYVMAMWLAREAYRRLKGEVQKGEFHVWEW
jgi:phage terminase large subunit-like protein